MMNKENLMTTLQALTANSEDITLGTYENDIEITVEDFEDFGDYCLDECGDWELEKIYRKFDNPQQVQAIFNMLEKEAKDIGHSLGGHTVFIFEDVQVFWGLASDMVRPRRKRKKIVRHYC